jgi:hypothetical protein
VKGQKGSRGEEFPLSVTTWLNPQTSLPTKRVVTCAFGGVSEMVIRESYRKVVLDGSVDGKKFEIPEPTAETIIEQ